jgi:hypothetical protein
LIDQRGAAEIREMLSRHEDCKPDSVVPIDHEQDSKESKLLSEINTSSQKYENGHHHTFLFVNRVTESAKN